MSEILGPRLVRVSSQGPSFEASLGHPQRLRDFIGDLFRVQSQAQAEMRAAAKAAGVPPPPELDGPSRP